MKATDSFLDRNFIKEFLSTYSPPGYEQPLQDLFIENLKLISPTSIKQDVIGNVVGQFGTQVSNAEHKPSIMIAAHADEIAWQISNITADGKIQVIRIGGSDESIAASRQVIIHLPENNGIRAVFGWSAIHVRDKDLKPTLENIYIDAGFDSKETATKNGVRPGLIVTYEENVTFLADNKLVSKAVDNKIGGLIILDAIRMFQREYPKTEQWPFIVKLANCVQEEVGCKGAKTVISNFMPVDMAIVTDVCHATDTFGYNQAKQGDIKLGHGAVLTHSSATSNFLNSRLVKAIDEQEWPVKEERSILQHMASGSSTGTDADAFAYEHGGRPTMLIKTPLRYMHTTVEMCSIQDASDVASSIALMLADIHDNFEDYKHLFVPQKNIEC